MLQRVSSPSLNHKQKSRPDSILDVRSDHRRALPSPAASVRFSNVRGSILAATRSQRRIERSRERMRNERDEEEKGKRGGEREKEREIKKRKKRGTFPALFTIFLQDIPKLRLCLEANINHDDVFWGEQALPLSAKNLRKRCRILLGKKKNYSPVRCEWSMFCKNSNGVE